MPWLAGVARRYLLPIWFALCSAYHGGQFLLWGAFGRPNLPIGQVVHDAGEAW